MRKRAYFAVAFIIAALAAFPILAGGRDSAQMYYEAGMKALSQDNEDAAIDQFTKALAQYALHAPSATALARIFASKSDLAAVKTLYEDYVKNAKSATLDRSEADFEKEAQDNLNVLKDISDVDKQYSKKFAALGKSLEKKDESAARDAYGVALELDGENREARKYLGEDGTHKPDASSEKAPAIEEDFEKPSASDPKSFDGWQKWGVAEPDGKEFTKGKSSVRLAGAPVGFNSGGIKRALQMQPPLSIEFDVKNGNEEFNKSAHSLRGDVYFFEAGRDAYGMGIFIFNADGFLYVGDKKTDFKWEALKWYHVKIRYEQDDKGRTVTAEIGGKKFKSDTIEPPEWVRAWRNVNIGLASGTGTAWFDNLTIRGRGDKESDDKKKVVGKINITEDFSDGKLDGHFALMNAGECTWKISSGVLTMKQTGKPTDAGVIIQKDNLNISKPMTIKTKVRFSNATTAGMYGYSCFAIAQKGVSPGIINGMHGKIYIVETPNGNIRILYVNKSGIEMCWNLPTQTWEVCTPAINSYNGPAAAYRIVEFNSDGKEFNIVLKDDSGKVIVKTSPVKWGDVHSIGAPYQFYFGEWSLGYYSADMEVDYINISYTSR
jgi:hypothetical protein